MVLLAALLLLAMAAGLALAPRGQVALADLRFQSPVDTPGPSSPLATPTFTPLPLPTETLPVAPATGVTPAPPLPSVEPPAVAPGNTPTPTVWLAEPIPLPEPSPQFIEPIIVPPEGAPGQPAAPEDRAPVEAQATARRLDLALFIDNLVIALGYAWLCYGLLAIVGAVLGGALLLRRRSRPSRQPGSGPTPPSPAPGERPTSPPPPAAPDAPAGPPPSAPRVAARRQPPPPPDMD